jgi:MFS family permease
MKWILPTIVVSQFCCTSLWFAGNAIIPDIINEFNLGPSFLANLTSAVQFGFIIGTLLFAVFTISDRFSPSKVFLCCALIASVFNLAISFKGIDSTAILIFRFFTGFFLAGIYPVGMKIASDYYQQGLGKSLGFLVGALVMGTAFPHLLKNMTMDLPWKYVVYATSALSALGGSFMWLLVPNGPFRKKSQQLNLRAFLSGFQNKNLRSAAFGYFGHMWELYTLWAFLPVLLMTYKNQNQDAEFSVPLLSFCVIACGGLSCAFGGILSQYFGPKKIATISLFLSCSCCICSPLFLSCHSFPILLTFLVFWGLVVTADSPLFSTLVAQNAPEESRGTSLTIVNCIGFAITIISIQLMKVLSEHMQTRYMFMVLAIGPVLGLAALLKNKDQHVLR